MSRGAPLPPECHFTRSRMAFGKRKRNRRKRRFKKRSKLADSKINTLIEKRIVAISKPARADTHQTEHMGSWVAGGRPGNWFALNPSPDPTTCSTALNTAPIYNPASHGADLIGKRIGDKIWLKGFRITGSLKLEGSNNMVHQKVCMAIISAKRPPNATATGPPVVNDYATSLMWNDMSGAMKTQVQVENYKSTQVIAKKYYTLKSISKNELHIPVSFSHFFKKPALQVYSNQDTTGAFPLNRSYYFCIFTDRETRVLTNPPADYVNSPVLFRLAIRKYFYTE